MIQADLKALFACLNPYCTQALENAAGVALTRHHHEITPEHLLHSLLEHEHCDLPHMLSAHDIEPLRLRVVLEQVLAGLEAGNAGRPVFAQALIEWIQDAWLEASLTLGGRQVRSGALLLAVLARAARLGAEPWALLLRGVSRQGLIDQADVWRAGSIEESTTGEVTGVDSSGAIARFCEDFTAKAAANGIDPVFGRDDEIRRMIDILARRRKNNPIAVGEPGVGKTAIVEGLALRIVQGDVPPFLQGTRLLSLDLGALEAGASVKGEFEKRLCSVLDEVRAALQPTLLFIDEAHRLVGAGDTPGGSDAANLLKPALARGELRMIAATTWSEYKKYFEKDPALARRFQLVSLAEPDVPTTVQILRGLRPHYEAAHGVSVRDEAVVSAAQLAGRYISGRLQPDKAVDLLDTACARVRIGLGMKPVALERLERQAAELERESRALERDRSEAGLAAQMDERLQAIIREQEQLVQRQERLRCDWLAEKSAVERVLNLRAQLAAEGESAASMTLRHELAQACADLHALQGQSPQVFSEVTGEVVAQVVSQWTGVPLGQIHRQGPQIDLATPLRQRIHGQAAALDTVVQVLEAAQVGLRDPRQPLGVFLLVGPSGVGKSETALAVAEHLFGGEQALITVNMSEFQEKHSLSRLVGSPPGYVGYGEGGVLTEAVRRRPYSVVLLDEVEKADLQVLNLFHQVFDKGWLADGEGRQVDFSNTVVFLTSNLGSEQISALCEAGPVPIETLQHAIRPRLAAHFKTALLARMTVVPFAPLGDEGLAAVVRLKLARWGERLMSTRGIALHVDSAVEQALCARCIDVHSGARQIEVVLNKSLLPMLSAVLLQTLAEQPPLLALRVSLDDDGGWHVARSYGAIPPDQHNDAAMRSCR